MSTRSWYMRIEDILEAINAIEEYTSGMDFAAWEKDRKTIDAVIRNCEIIGEAATHVPEEVQRKYLLFTWVSPCSLRSLVSKANGRETTPSKSVFSQSPQRESKDRADHKSSTKTYQFSQVFSAA